MKNSHAQGIRWDLSDLYTSIEDLKIEDDLKQAFLMAEDLENVYKHYFDDPENIVTFPVFDFLNEYKKIVTFTAKLGSFAQLSFSEKTDDFLRGAFLQKIQNALTDIQTHLIFFEVGWNRLKLGQIDELLQDPRIQPDMHFLNKLRSWAPHTLEQGEEKILALKANTSSRAFSRLFDETVNSIPFLIDENGQKKKKTEGEILSLLHSPIRDLRQKASASLAEGLTSQNRLITYIFNMILADHKDIVKIRKFRHPMHAMNLSNEISLESVLNLIESVKKNYALAARHYELKKKLLGLDSFYDYDRYAPIDTEEGVVSFSECKNRVLSSYYEFSESAGKIVEQFFDKSWIDAEIREGKQGGGFCCQTIPALHPYILVNYTGSLRDVMTVAHELGHGLHQYLAGKKVGILESDAPLIMAETASVFGEMLTFEKLLADEKNPKKRLSLLCGKIDDNIATVYRQIVLTDFELSIHETALKEGELSTDRLSDLWIMVNHRLYGNSVELTDNYRHGWKYIPHFIHSPFYCYAYAFAQLVVLCLYEKYKENKSTFVTNYLEMLALGGSRKPRELAGMVGLNIEDMNLWDKGLTVLDRMISEAEKMNEELA